MPSQSMCEIPHLSSSTDFRLLPLFFRTMAVSWTALRAGLQPEARGYNEVKPFSELAWLPTAADRLQTFPIPGSLQGSDNSSVIVCDSGLRFPEVGEYYLASSRGIFKLLVLPSSPQPSDLLSIAAFIGKNAVHSSADHWLVAPRGLGLPFDLSKVHKKLFYSDQPLALECGEIADVLSAELHLAGFQTRRVWVYEAASQTGHIVTEAFCEVRNSWIMLDADFGVAIVDEDGQFLSTAEIAARRETRRQLRVVDLAHKPTLDTRFYFGPDFVGWYSWRREHCGSVRMADASHYLDNVVGRTFEKVCYYQYDYTDLGSITYRPLALE